MAFAEDLEIQYQARANMDDATQATKDEASKPKISLGMVYHRGNPTPQPFSIKVEDLVRHTLIAAPRVAVKAQPLNIFWFSCGRNIKFHSLFFIRLTSRITAIYLRFQPFENNLLIFTLGDASTSPFQFNPFEVPHGLLIKTHISRLMRVFMAAFTLQEPLPMIYRKAFARFIRKKVGIL